MENTTINGCYAFGKDPTGGWGDRYFFSYFSLLGNLTMEARISELMVAIATSLVSLAVNLMITACVIKFPELRTPSNIYHVNLAAASIMFTLAIHSAVYSRWTSEGWQQGDVMCKCTPFILAVTENVMQWTSALISIDRRRCVIIPRIGTSLTHGKAACYSIILWIVAAVVCSPTILWFREQPVNTGVKICTFVVPKTLVHFAVYVMLPLFILIRMGPPIVMFYNCGIICKKIIATKSVWAKSCVEFVDHTKTLKTRRQSELSVSDLFIPFPRRHSTLSHQEELRVNRHVRVVKMLAFNVAIVIAIALCSTTAVILIFVDSNREDANYFLSSHHFMLLFLTTFILTAANSINHGFCSDNYRVCILKMLLCVDNEEAATTRQHGRHSIRKTPGPEGPGVT